MIKKNRLFSQKMLKKLHSHFTKWKKDMTFWFDPFFLLIWSFTLLYFISELAKQAARFSSPYISIPTREKLTSPSNVSNAVKSNDCHLTYLNNKLQFDHYIGCVQADGRLNFKKMWAVPYIEDSFVHTNAAVLHCSFVHDIFAMGDTWDNMTCRMETRTHDVHVTVAVGYKYTNKAYLLFCLYKYLTKHQHVRSNMVCNKNQTYESWSMH